MQTYGQLKLFCLEDMMSDIKPMIWVSRLKIIFALLVHLSSCLNVDLFYGFQRAPVTSNFYSCNSLIDLNISIPTRQLSSWWLLFSFFWNPNLLLYWHIRTWGYFSALWLFSFYSGKALFEVDCRQISWWDSTAVIFLKLYHRKRQFFPALGLVLFKCKFIKW